MAKFYKAYRKLKRLEYRNCLNALHKNPTENYWTFMGITQKHHKNSYIWKIMYELFKKYKDKKIVSQLMCKDRKVLKEVKSIYKKEYWDIAKLDKVNSQKIAEEIFIFGVNAGMKNAIKLAQKIVGVSVDGIVGKQTLKALNNFDEDLFDILYDAEEAKYYMKLIEKNPKLKIYKKGWLRRAKYV